MSNQEDTIEGSGFTTTRDTPDLPDFQGTPKNLDELTVHVIRAICMGVMNEQHERVLNVLRDYIANKLQASMIEAKSPEEENRFKELFNHLVARG